MPSKNVSRRELLKIGAATATAELAAVLLPGCGGGPSPGPAPSVCSKLTDIEHVVIFIQENRSFDHYFGSYRGVRGFSDQSLAFQQPDPTNTTNSPMGVLLPFHLDTSKTNAACTHDITPMTGCRSIRAGAAAQWHQPRCWIASLVHRRMVNIESLDTRSTTGFVNQRTNAEISRLNAIASTSM